uniref:Uncharacterized protein n=1 Tax=Romanomermis culicivorax TaxID=13658 RepID=A0A915HT46_ROMCU
MFKANWFSDPTLECYNNAIIVYTLTGLSVPFTLSIPYFWEPAPALFGRAQNLTKNQARALQMVFLSVVWTRFIIGYIFLFRIASRCAFLVQCGAPEKIFGFDDDVLLVEDKRRQALPYFVG